ncbi:tRNA 2-selenouridine synthase [Endozoicomonas montiporae]|uniref:tRNA 2-selenouridine synthase n=2 Tax=Endozoicomonas montiporae TaxID=1027273 RepID=A0A081N812_9GAMM|nr:tRNA 2-selenouridine(34) synthase MnmH [Endozoicomonas montiporae]AMO55534.1 tRNA 2-selenouridine synthase, selenophosphate-dependent [Endozoicomonas montiporae CL-33]KEQ14585.1 tRNA 2-selenouridine synthase [Endozoicomonas montiporae]
MSQTRSDTDDFKTLFLNDTPLMDVRAPVEFEQGAFPKAQNVPILDNHQREIIGTCYKREGSDAAVALGYELATDEIRAARLNNWKAFTEKHPNGYLYCFRGGQRSHLTQAWLKEAGVHYPLIKGGYKALRRFLIDQLEASVEACSFVILSGKTGTGKTRLLHKISDSIDLEGLANHRGSSFGRRCGGQPTQIDFENRLSIALMKHLHHKPERAALLEDESKLIGRCSLSQPMRDKMQQSPIILLETSVEERVEVGLQEYVRDNLADFTTVYGEEAGFEQFREGLAGSLYRIRRRLGGARYQALNSLLENALQRHHDNDDIDGYRPLIADLLKEYYDPMYEYQLEQKEGKVIFKGNHKDIQEAYPELVKAVPA